GPRTRTWCLRGSSKPACCCNARRRAHRPSGPRSSRRDSPPRSQTAPRTPSPSWGNHATDRPASLASWPNSLLSHAYFTIAPELRGQAWSELAVLRGHGDNTNTIGFDRVSQKVLTGSTDANTFVWSLVDPTVSKLVAPPSPHL